MKELLKKLLPDKVVQNLSYLKNWNHNLYSINTKINLNTNFSDFFVWNKDCTKIEFIGENLRALLMGKEIEVTHNFRFFSAEGKFIELQQFNSNSFFEKIKLEACNDQDKYYSFTHFVDSNTNLEEILFSIGVRNTNDLSELNRGYTVYYPGPRNSSCIVHGNFGGISKDINKRAITNFRKHIYTPVYKFQKKEKYDLVFNNPTNKEIKVKLILNNSNKIYFLSIPSLGTRFQNISNYSGSISYESRLSVCRALVFKNPAPNQSGTFDVFHS